MAGMGLITIEEQTMPSYGFSVSVGNIIESSDADLGSPEPETLPVTIKNGKREKTGQSSKSTRKKISSQALTVKTTNLADDGCGWRKYGQKIIHNQQYPKSYYRCTHYKEEKCSAKKWIQQESENPPVYKTTYLGHHTCKNPHKIPQIFSPHYYSPLSHSPENLSMPSSASATVLIRFDAPTTNNVFNVNCQDDQTMKTCDNTVLNFSSPPLPIPSSSWSDDSMMLFEDQADTCPPIPSPDCSFGSFDFDTMMRDYYLLDLDKVDLMEDC